MDIKLKSNKRFSLLAVFLTAALFAGSFMALYPTFESKVGKYTYTKDDLSGSGFLECLYFSNYILYKDIVEKVEGVNCSYEELYLDIEEKNIAEIGETVPESEFLYEEIDAIPGQMRDQLGWIFSNWEDKAMYMVSQKMDYCVIDDATGQSVKNTGRNIEAISRRGQEMEKEELPYVYYVMVTYDGIGNPDKVAVKGENPDELLKSVQTVMKSRRLESQLQYGYDRGYYNGETIYYGYSSINGNAKRVSCSIGAPKNTTFIYALTQGQKDMLIKEEGFGSGWNGWYAYYNEGVGNVFLVLLGMLTVVALLLMLNRRYCLHHTRAVRIPVEVTVILAYVILSISWEASISLVNITSQGYLDDVWREYLIFLPAECYPVLTGAVNFAVLFLLFGSWLYTVNTLGEIPMLGVKGFLKERSLCIRLTGGLYRRGKKFWQGFKYEMLHVDLKEDVGYILHKAVLINFLLLGILCSMWLFGWLALVIYSFALYFLLKKYIKKLQDQYRRMLQATESIAEGNLHTTFDEDFGVFVSYKEALYRIQEGFRKAVDEEVKSQRMKAELITNVSHDLKTPLTAITTYVDLLKEDGVTEEQRREYIGVLEKKSLRLKRLIEDLFEVSKATSRNVTVNLVEVDICNLMRQAYLEYEDKVEDADLIFRFRMPEEKIILKLDSEKTYRIFENLYSNIIKYAMAGSRVYIDVEKRVGTVVIGLRNMSAVELHVAPEELTERFVRGDSARNTEGSGLGLAIARSFTEIQGGKMEIVVDGDLFKVVLTWKCEEDR